MASEQPWQSYHTVFTNAKAGMDGVDKKKVQKVVYDMSKGSKYFENEQRKEALVQQRVQHMQAQAARLSNADLGNYEKVADAKLVELEASRDLLRTWMHVDLDAFYAAVETLENPSLVGKPMAVGGTSMICTANYEARKFGVRAAMPGFIARRLCPDLVFVPPNFVKYSRYSEQVREVFHEYDPQFLARSLDEAYLDITEQCSRRNVTAGEVAEELRRRVQEKTGLTCSAGVGPNRMVAKVCSDMNKPNGQFVVPNERGAVIAFFSALPIRKVSGIGKVTERLLKDVLDIVVCADLIQKRALITALFSPISTDFFLSVGLGIGGSDTPQEEARKSLSCERTFTATSCESSLFAKLEDLADNLSKDMAVEGLQGRTLTLKLKTINFEVRTRSLSLQGFVHKKEELLFHASKLLKAELPLSLRLMGLRISHFQGDSADPSQRTIYDFMHGSCPQLGENSNSDTTDNSPPYRDEVSQEQNHAQIKNLESCSLQALPEISKTQALSFISCSGSPNPKKRLLPLADPQGCPGTWNEYTSTSGRISERDQIPYSHEKSKQAISPHKFVFDMEPDFTNCGYDTAMESSFSHVMIWVDDNYCSLCGLEIPPYFTHERQEHTDFHYAQMLQQDFSNSGIFDKSGDCKQQNKRLHSSSKKATPKKGSIGRPESSKEKSKNVPIDAFFPKTCEG